MIINKLNYENYVIDYIEGTIDLKLKVEFDRFLEKHPEVYEEIKEYLAAPVLKADTSIQFEDKASLMKPKGSNWKKLVLMSLLIGVVSMTMFYLMYDEGKVQGSIEDTPLMITKNSQKDIGLDADKIKENKIITIENKEEQTKERTNDGLQKAVPNETKSLQEKPSLETNSKSQQPVEEPKELPEHIYMASVEEKQDPMDFEDKRIVIPELELENTIPNRGELAEVELVAIQTVSLPNTINSKPILDLEFSESIEREVQTKNNFISLFKPQAFEDLNLKEAIVDREPILKKENLLKSLAPRAITN